MKDIKSNIDDNKSGVLNPSKRSLWLDLAILILIIYNVLIIIAIRLFGLIVFLEFRGRNDRSLIGLFVFIVDIVYIFVLQLVIEAKDDTSDQSTNPTISYSFEIFIGYWLGFFVVILALIKYQTGLDGYCDQENDSQGLNDLIFGFIWFSSVIISLISPFRNRSINFTWKLAFLSSWFRFIYILIFHLIAVYLFPLFNDPCPVGF
ncbi:MAG: hypothetical protein HeimC2_27590 [Candidatus Heimdallarchaeota archaeon LC_2]|nr:MAG: hypothetical protein HeimC2_27590 [Candidatus Heimdallarchaeota archaeon LC_2]